MFEYSRIERSWIKYLLQWAIPYTCIGPIINSQKPLVRTLVAADVENTSEGPTSTVAQIQWRHAHLQHLFPSGSTCLYEVACSHKAALNAKLGFPSGRHRWRSGPDGADGALAEVLYDEGIPKRFSHVVIASGDHYLVDVVAHLAAQGVHCTVVSAPSKLSRQLRMAAHVVIELPEYKEQTPYPDAA